MVYSVIMLMITAVIMLLYLAIMCALLFAASAIVSSLASLIGHIVDEIAWRAFQIQTEDPYDPKLDLPPVPTGELVGHTPSLKE